MAGFKVEWTRAASRDLEEIISYIALDSPTVAEALLKKLQRRARALKLFPARGRLVPELLRFEIRSYRELLVRPYRVLYRIAGKTVFVVGAFDGRRDLSEAILQRLLRN